MGSFFKKIFKKYKIEVIIITTAFLIAVISLGLFFVSIAPKNNIQIVSQEPEAKENNNKIFIDLSGAVKKPAVYRLVAGSRLEDVLKLASGLTDEADVDFFHRNFNLARILTDQEKIYIPSKQEVGTGVLPQISQTLDYSLLVNVNSATLEELDSLPGIGETTANKIIDNRPYQSIEELVTKKAINKGVLEKIKNQIVL